VIFQDAREPSLVADPIRRVVMETTIPTLNNGKSVSRVFGAGDEVRTHDINLGKVALYQLSYARIVVFSNIKTRLEILVPSTRIELVITAYQADVIPFNYKGYNRMHFTVSFIN